jgi:hypothetical protein
MTENSSTEEKIRVEVLNSEVIVDELTQTQTVIQTKKLMMFFTPLLTVVHVKCCPQIRKQMDNFKNLERY